MRTFVLLSVAFLAPGSSTAQRPAVSPQVRQFVAVDTPVVALTRVRVVDGTGTAPAEDQTIVIRDGRIAAVGPAARVRPPAGARGSDPAGGNPLAGFAG